MLDDIKILLGIYKPGEDELDPLLNLLIRQATDEAIRFTRNDNVCDLESVIEKMVVYNYNRLGTEGVEAENYSGVSFDYAADYPESIMRCLRANRKLITL